MQSILSDLEPIADNPVHSKAHLVIFEGDICAFPLRFTFKYFAVAVIKTITTNLVLIVVFIIEIVLSTKILQQNQV